MGWSRKGRKGAFRYYDSGGKWIGDEAKLARIEARAIASSWKDVSISPRGTAKLQATGFDAAGRKYRYSADYRAQQERAKYDRLIRFDDALPALREAMVLHFDQEEIDRERVSAIALIRVRTQVKIYLGEEFSAKDFRTWGGTLLAAIFLAECAAKEGFPESNASRSVP